MVEPPEYKKIKITMTNKDSKTFLMGFMGLPAGVLIALILKWLS